MNTARAALSRPPESPKTCLSLVSSLIPQLPCGYAQSAVHRVSRTAAEVLDPALPNAHRVLLPRQARRPGQRSLRPVSARVGKPTPLLGFADPTQSRNLASPEMVGWDR